jgi:hypothetical protein
LTPGPGRLPLWVQLLEKWNKSPYHDRGKS